MMRVWRM